MNGLVSPQGHFYSCRIGHHRDIIFNVIPDNNTQTWLYVCPDNVWADTPLTDQQIQWIRDTKKKSYLRDLEVMLIRDDRLPIDKP